MPLSPTRRKTRSKADKLGEPGLNRDQIIDAALHIIDRDGIEAFSMRNLAKELGVYPTAIYWHIPTRNAIIGEVIGKVLSDLVPDEISHDWKAGLRGLFRNYRDRIRAHPNIAPMIGVQLVSNASIDFGMIEKILAALSAAGFPDDRLPAAFSVVIGAMVGFTTQEFALVPADDKEQWAETMQAAINSADPARHPTATRLMSQLANRTFILRWQNGADAPLDSGFEMFVDAVVEGLERLVPR